MQKEQETTTIVVNAKEMQRPEYVLELLSAGREPEKHSLCPHCRHIGLESCPYLGTEKKLGMCPAYTFNQDPLAGSKIVEYLKKRCNGWSDLVTSH